VGDVGGRLGRMALATPCQVESGAIPARRRPPVVLHAKAQKMEDPAQGWGNCEVSPRFDDLICPDCHTALLCDVKGGQGNLACPEGHGPWPVENGVARFIAAEVPHVGRWMEIHREPRGWGPIRWLRQRDGHWRIPYLLRPMLARAGHHPLDIIDLGCGGWWEFLTAFGRVTGIDYGAEALADAASVYGRVVRSGGEERRDVDI